MHRLFRVPELVDFILQHVSRREVLSGLYVSRAFFSSAAPILWKRLYRASDLLLLITGARLVDVATGSVQIVELPFSLKSSYFTRFNVYAPLVKSLTITPTPHFSPFPKHRDAAPLRLDSLINWQVLIDFLNGSALLPNSGAIFFRYPDYTACLNWLRVLLSPSVHDLSAIYTFPEWPMEVVSEMLELAGQKSPDLDDLFIPVRGFEVGHITDDPDPDSLPQRQLRLLSCFSAFQKLRSLRSNITLLYPQAIPILGELPCLERIMLSVGPWEIPPLRYNFTLSETAFPRLRELILEQVLSRDWILDLWSLEPMFKNLDELSIEMNLATPSSERDEDWADEFFSRLCRQSPKLRELSVLAGGIAMGEPSQILSRSTQEEFKLLSFKSLMIRGLCFEDGCSFLCSAWPNVVALSFSDQRASLVDLAQFAQNLPNLETLELDADMSGSNIPDLNSPHLQSPRHKGFSRLCAGNPKPFERTRYQNEKLARYLHSLWPNVHCSYSWWNPAGSGEHSNFESEEGGEALKQLKALDNILNTLRKGSHLGAAVR